MSVKQWASILILYAISVLGIASLVIMIPLQGDLVSDFGMSIGQYGVWIGLIGIPAAILATISGKMVDRFGPRNMAIFAALLAAIPNFAYWAAPDSSLFLPLRLIEGISFSIILATGPAYIMRTSTGKSQLAAMTLWSTATPTAISLGMLVGGIFAATPGWKDAFFYYAIALVVMGIVGLLVPKLAAVEQERLSLSGQVKSLLEGYKQSAAVKLGLMLLLIASSSLGLNTILPSYLTEVHNISIGTASGLIAGANLAMIAGAVLIGFVLSRNIAPALVLGGLMLGAIGFLAMVMFPDTAIGMIAVMFAGWSLMVGAAQTIVFAVLPKIADPDAPGLATGVVNQLASLASFVAPMIFLALIPNGWTTVVLVIAGFWLVSVVLLKTISTSPSEKPAEG